jgi:protein-disulfide isomerase
MPSSQSGILAAAVFGVLITACSSSAQQQARPAAPDDVVATIGSRKVTLAEVDRAALDQPAANFGPMKLSQAVYEARRAALEEIVGDALIEQEARAKNVDRDALVQQEITAHVAPVTDSDISAWYQANQNRIQGRSLDQVKEPIRSLLTEQRTEAARRTYIDQLRAKTAVRLSLDPPRQQVAAAGRPARGPENAPVEIIEFSDFQCPYCLRAEPAVRQVLSTYGDKVRLVYRHFPLSNHPNARPAAEAAACAAEQGKFWEYHDRLFANPTKLSPTDFKDDAAGLGLDAARFDSCVADRKYTKDIEADMKAGEEAGVNGTPAFFINGRLLSGAQPFEAFKRVIDDELEQKRTSR